MKIMVAVKRVIDPYVKIRVKSDQSGVESQNVKMAMNPFDEIALEAAIRIAEANDNVEIILVSIGSKLCQDTLRQGLAMGATRAILIETELDLSALNIAKILRKQAEAIQPDLILMGKQAIDSDHNQCPQMLAALLDRPQATNASKIQLEGQQVRVTREIDGGLETLLLDLPAVISADLRLNEPRYASLPNIMKAKQKPLDLIPLDSLGLNLSKHSEILSVTAPPGREAGRILDSVQSLLDALQHEAKLL